VTHRDPHGIALRRYPELTAATYGLASLHAPILRDGLRRGPASEKRPNVRQTSSRRTARLCDRARRDPCSHAALRPFRGSAVPGGPERVRGFASRRPRVRIPHAPCHENRSICRSFLRTGVYIGNAGASAVRADAADFESGGVEYGRVKPVGSIKSVERCQVASISGAGLASRRSPVRSRYAPSSRICSFAGLSLASVRRRAWGRLQKWHVDVKEVPRFPSARPPGNRRPERARRQRRRRLPVPALRPRRPLALRPRRAAPGRRDQFTRARTGTGRARRARARAARGGDDRQRLRLYEEPPLPRAARRRRRPPDLDPALHPALERQGRALHRHLLNFIEGSRGTLAG
jgi:hypothetical protein